mmetsp:Transcript_59808/g.110716  ORF Transcript_59808/g.110716 Transcript_59808/m.110716 type:complete len:233 (+) Transcript_59808:88-786(+)
MKVSSRLSGHTNQNIQAARKAPRSSLKIYTAPRHSSVERPCGPTKETAKAAAGLRNPPDMRWLANAPPVTATATATPKYSVNLQGSSTTMVPRKVMQMRNVKIISASAAGKALNSLSSSTWTCGGLSTDATTAAASAAHSCTPTKRAAWAAEHFPRQDAVTVSVTAGLNCTPQMSPSANIIERTAAPTPRAHPKESAARPSSCVNTIMKVPINSPAIIGMNVLVDAASSRVP